MIVCPNCQHHNHVQATHCAQCGQSLADAVYRVCPSCGALNPIEGQFCQRCLTDLTAPTAKAQPTPTPPDTTPEAAPVESVPTEPAPQPVKPKPNKRETKRKKRRDRNERAAQREIAPLPDPAEGREYKSAESGLAELGGDPLAGVADVLPLETAVALPHRGSPPSELRSEHDEQEDARLFSSLASEPAPLTAAAQQVLPPLRSELPRWLKLVLSLLLVLAACVPSLSPGWLPAPTTPSAGTSAMLSALSSLGSDAQVLIAYEYGPDHAAELDPVAERLLEQLADQGVRVHLLSTEPAGLGLAEQMLHGSDSLQMGLDNGQLQVLGLLPGREIGVRTLMRSVESAFRMQTATSGAHTTDLTHTPTRVSGFDHVILLGDDSRAMRAWIEQAPPTLHPLAIVTAQVYPALVPYEASGQLATLVQGPTAAIELQASTSQRITPTGASDGLAALFLVVLCVAILANVLPVKPGKTR